MLRVFTTAVYDTWIDGLRDRAGRARILVQVGRMAAGNRGDAKSVGDGVSEMRINAVPGYRIYFTEKTKGEIVILLCGGD